MNKVYFAWILRRTAPQNDIRDVILNRNAVKNSCNK